MLRSKLLKRAAIAATATFGLSAIPAIASPSSGVTFTTLTVQNFLDPDHINSDRIKFQTKDETIVRIQSATWNENSTSGWHHHPGVIIGGSDFGFGHCVGSQLQPEDLWAWSPARCGFPGGR